MKLADGKSGQGAVCTGGANRRCVNICVVVLVDMLFDYSNQLVSEPSGSCVQLLIHYPPAQTVI